jgi:thiamine kinase-like enzyme
LKNHEPHSSISDWNLILEKLILLKNKIDTEQQISTSIAHTDLTPWNCFCDNQKLYIYDWELAVPNAPALYDLFHFHLQGNCLLGNQPFKIVNQKLQLIIQQKSIQHFAADNSINMALHLKLYLLYHVSTSMCWYAVQPNLHLQVHWLMKLWNDYLDEILQSN